MLAVLLGCILGNKPLVQYSLFFMKLCYTGTVQSCINGNQDCTYVLSCLQSLPQHYRLIVTTLF